MYLIIAAVVSTVLLIKIVGIGGSSEFLKPSKNEENLQI